MASVIEETPAAGPMPAVRKRVLFHAYYFPPIGGAGAQRPARFVRSLHERGWDPIVVTGPGPSSNRWTPADASLAADVPAEIAVHRVSKKEPELNDYWAGRFQRILRLKRPWTRWWMRESLELSLTAAGEAGGVDLLYAWMQPYDSAEPAAAAARTLGVPWVADLGDPWALDEMMVYPSRLHRALERRRMYHALSSAAAIVMSTPEAARALVEAFPRLRDRTVVVIPNGYDGSDFEGPEEQRDDGRFRIVHTGYLATELGARHRRTLLVRRILGGAENVKISTRSHLVLLEALRQLFARRPELERTVELHLAGVVASADLVAIGNAEYVQVHGYVPHDEAVRFMRTADLLFLPMHDLPPGTRARLVPGKTYEYLASRRPILAGVPDGDARDILAAAGGASLCRPDDAAAMSAEIEDSVDRWLAGDTAIDRDSSVVERYEYGRLAGELISVFELVAEQKRPIARRT